jgi:hypothetical protein
MGGKRDTYTGFWWVDLRARRRWEDIKIDKEVDGAEHGLDWIDMAQDNYMVPALVCAE